jgi:hypothetical protein
MSKVWSIADTLYKTEDVRWRENGIMPNPTHRTVAIRPARSAHLPDFSIKERKRPVTHDWLCILTNICLCGRNVAPSALNSLL